MLTYSVAGDHRHPLSARGDGARLAALHARQLGYFSASYRVVENLFFFPSLLVGSAFPIFAHAAHADSARFALCDLAHVRRRADRRSLALAVADRRRAAGDRCDWRPEFLPAAPVLAVQGISVAAVFVSTVWASALLSLHLHRAILILNLSLLAPWPSRSPCWLRCTGRRAPRSRSPRSRSSPRSPVECVLVRGRPHARRACGCCRRSRSRPRSAPPRCCSRRAVVGRLALSTCIYAGVLLGAARSPPIWGELLGLRERLTRSRRRRTGRRGRRGCASRGQRLGGLLPPPREARRRCGIGAKRGASGTQRCARLRDRGRRWARRP